MGLLLFVTMIVLAAGRYYGLDAIIVGARRGRTAPETPLPARLRGDIND